MILSTNQSPTMVYIVVACIGADTGSLLSVYNRCGHRPIYCKPVHDKQFTKTVFSNVKFNCRYRDRLRNLTSECKFVIILNVGVNVMLVSCLSTLRNLKEGNFRPTEHQGSLLVGLA